MNKYIKKQEKNYNKISTIATATILIGALLSCIGILNTQSPKIKEVKILEIKDTTIVVEYDNIYEDIDKREIKKPIIFFNKIGDKIIVKNNNGNIKPFIYQYILLYTLSIIGAMICCLGFIKLFIPLYISPITKAILSRLIK